MVQSYASWKQKNCHGILNELVYTVRSVFMGNVMKSKQRGDLKSTPKSYWNLKAFNLLYLSFILLFNPYLFPPQVFKCQASA